METLQRNLAERLFAGDSQQAWLLIDAMSMDVRDCVGDVPDEDIHIVPLARKDIPTERYPHLVSVRSHDVERLRASIDWALEEQSDSDFEQQNGFVIGGWLASDAPPTALVRHLAMCMTQRPAGQGRKYFRWADRRVMTWMWQSMDSTARTALLGPVTTWWTLDRTGELVEHSTSDALVSSALHPTWRITDIDWERARNCEPVQALLRGWQRFAPNLPRDYLDRATRAVNSARSLGLTDMADLVLVAAYVIQIHPNLCSHPLMQTQVRNARIQNESVADALGKIPDPEGWDRMREELTHAGTPATQLPRNKHHG
ncbi:MAG: DUF4123 domain-containing protein [Rhodanobacter sp.]